MSEDQVQAIADRAAQAAVKAMLADENRCLFDIDPETHAKHHELATEAIEVLTRVKEIKWAIVRFLAYAAVVGVLALIGINIQDPK